MRRMWSGEPRIIIGPMLPGDIPQVMEIDRLSFPQPWSEQSYRFELMENRNAHFLTAYVLPPRPIRNWLEWLRRPSRARRVVGYVGVWLVADEAHINTLAVHPDWRQRGIGEQLLVAMLQKARALNALTATLEVRASNVIAQRLYQRYGFQEVGRRPRYYRDGEDALLMTARLDVNTPSWQAA